MTQSADQLNLMPQWLSPEAAIALTEEHGTPLHIYSQEALQEQAFAAQEMGAPYGLNVRFAMKANSNPEVLHTFLTAGLDIDASSGEEAEMAMEAGFEPSQILITSQMIPKNLEMLVRVGVLYNATSLHQLENYCQLFPGGNVSVRINPGVGDGMNNRTNTGGLNSPFGIWHEEIPRVHEIAKRSGVTINKVHTHIGSGTDPEAWQDAALTSLAIVEQFPDATSLDLGGGFKVGRMPGESSADMSVIGRRLEQLLKDFAAKTGRELQLEIEPGTFLVANAGVILSEVMDLKNTGTGEGSRSFYLVDSGMGNNMRPATYGAQHPLTVVGKDGRLPEESAEVVVVGPHCESGDILTPAPGNPEEITARTLGVAAVGDIVVIGGTGAYGATMSAKRYCGFEPAEEILI